MKIELCCFKLEADVVRNGIRKFVYDTDRPAFLKRQIVRFGVHRYWEVRVYNSTN